MQTALFNGRLRSPVARQRLINKSLVANWCEAKIVNPVARFPPLFLREAASSNMRLQGTRREASSCFASILPARP